MDASELEARGLYDPEAPNAADRLALLEWLCGKGVSLDQMVDALREGRLTGLAGDLALRPGERLTLEEIADRARVTPAEALRLYATIGLPAPAPGERAFAPGDARALSVFGPGASIFGEEALLRFTRVLGASLNRIAEAAVSLFIADVEAPLARSEAGELALARANLEAIATVNVLPELMDAIFRVHMEHAIRRSRMARAPLGATVTQRLAIGFVDLVGFTPLAQRLDVAELSALVDEFERVAFDLVARNGGRVVKLIGDEVMFAAVDAAAACRIALTLVEHFGATDTRVTPRGGLAFGEVLTLGGDYYGAEVNVASRIAELAVRNEILVTPELHAQVQGQEAALRFVPAGRRMLKGFEDPVELFTVEPA